jgi:hypothetical protein
MAESGLPDILRLYGGSLTVFEQTSLFGTLSDPFEVNRQVALKLLTELGMDVATLDGGTIESNVAAAAVADTASGPDAAVSTVATADSADSAGTGAAADTRQSNNSTFHEDVLNMITGADARTSAHATLLLHAAVKGEAAVCIATSNAFAPAELVDRLGTVRDLFLVQRDVMLTVATFPLENGFEFECLLSSHW